MSSSFKRARVPSPPTLSLSSSPEPEPTPKAQRTLPLPSNSLSFPPLICTLPPTCNHRPTPLANSTELEAHYATYHAHVCEQSACASVFPDPRLLELHQTECHDPLAALRKDRGEKIFACHLSTCSRFFLTPKARRLHLIQAHGYPKEYFFAVTNKGVGGLLKRWGEGASLIRGQWKAREAKADSDKSDEDGPEQDGDESEHETPLQENTQAQATVRKGAAPPAETATAKEAAIDALTDSLGALALVPPSVRFGRGTRRGGFSHQDAGHNSHQQAAAGAQRGGLRAHSPLQTGRGATAVAADAGHAFSEDSPGAVATSAGADEGRTAVTGNGRGRARGLSRGMPPPRGGAIRMPGNFAMARGRGGARGTVMGPARGFASVGRGRGARGGAL